MGRRIPGRKHKGVRDPEKQRQIKLSSIKDKINTAPANPDEQHMSKRLLHIIELKDKLKDGTLNLNRKRKHKNKTALVTSHPNGVRQKFDRFGKPEKPTPVFTQYEGESNRSFMSRVNRVCTSVIKEAAFENKYGVDITRNPITGEVLSVDKRKKDELEELVKKLKKEKNTKGKDKNAKGKKKKKADKTDEPKLTKSQKRTLKQKEKKQKKANYQIDEFKNYEDHVKFGEIVHAPPSLPAPRKVSKTETPRPGKKDLLLKSVLQKKDSEPDDKPTVKEKTKKSENKAIDRKGKRKDLPFVVRKQIEKQRDEIVKAYKMLKASKYINR